MTQSPYNAIYLFENSFISEKEFKEYLAETTLEDDVVEKVLQMKNRENENLLSPEELLELYLKENISLNSIKKVEEILPLINEKELVKNYRKLENCTPEEKIKIERYFSLFRETKLAGKNEETKQEIANNIILELGDDMEEKDFIELYKRNVIYMETIIDWNSPSLAIEMFKKGVLKPADSKKLVNQGIINIEKIKAGILNGLTNEEKITTIVTMFDDENQDNLRYALFQTLGVSADEKTENQSNRSDRKKSRKEQAAELSGKSYEFDPCYKIQLLSILDKDYRASLTKDGHMIFELPNNNQVIIEKMFKYTKEGIIIPATDTATYILDLETIHLENILTNTGKINRSKLYELAKKDKATRYYHTKNWGEKIKEVFDIEHSERHTAEDKRKIDDIIEKSKRTRKLRTI